MLILYYDVVGQSHLIHDQKRGRVKSPSSVEYPIWEVKKGLAVTEEFLERIMFSVEKFIIIGSVSVVYQSVQSSSGFCLSGCIGPLLRYQA